MTRCNNCGANVNLVHREGTPRHCPLCGHLLLRPLEESDEAIAKLRTVEPPKVWWDWFWGWVRRGRAGLPARRGGEARRKGTQ